MWARPDGDDGGFRMIAGKLDRRIVIERATTTTNNFGEEVATWAPLVEVWAHVIDVSDGERWRAAEVAATVTTRFQVRWNDTTKTIGPKDRVLYEGRAYDISHTKEIQRRVGVEITASARAG
jgi:SPP1 family predicted phage head-tail adaptor